MSSPSLPPASYISTKLAPGATPRSAGAREARNWFHVNRGTTCSKMQVVFLQVFKSIQNLYIWWNWKRAKGKADVWRCSTVARKVSLQSGPLAVHENLEKSLSKTCRASLVEVIQKLSTTEGHKEMWPRCFAFKDRIHDSFHEPWNIWESVIITIKKY